MQEKGMMSKTLAEKIGISEVSVSALVNGKSNNLETLAKAAERAQRDTIGCAGG